MEDEKIFYIIQFNNYCVGDFSTYTELENYIKRNHLEKQFFIITKKVNR